MNLPIDFIHIGFPKTASTFLQQYLHCHSEIELGNGHVLLEMVSNKKPHKVLCDQFLDVDVDKKSFRMIRYFNFLMHRKNSEDFIIDKSEKFESHKKMLYGFSREELSTSHMFGKSQLTIAKNIHQINPNMKIIIIIRDQFELIASFYIQTIKQGGVMNFTEYYCSSEMQDLLNDLNYNLIIDEYIRLFGRDNIFLYRFEDLRNDDKLFIKRISSFLNISYVDSAIPERKINPSYSYPILILFRTLNSILQHILLFNIEDKKMAGYRFHGIGSLYYRGIFKQTERLNERIFKYLVRMIRYAFDRLNRFIFINKYFYLDESIKTKVTKKYIQSNLKTDYHIIKQRYQE